MVKIVNGAIVPDNPSDSGGGQASSSSPSSSDLSAMAMEEVSIFGVKAPKWSLLAGLLFAFFVGGMPGALILGVVLGAGYYSGQQGNSSQVN